MPIIKELKSYGFAVKFDVDEEKRPGFKFAEYELKGVPVRMAIGMRDLANGTIEVARRDTLTKEVRSMEGIAEYIKNLMDEIQTNIYQKALNFRKENTFEINTWADFKEQIEKLRISKLPSDENIMRSIDRNALTPIITVPTTLFYPFDITV